MQTFRLVADLKTPIIFNGELTLDGLLAAVLFDELQDVDRAHSEVPVKCIEGLYWASSAQLEVYHTEPVAFTASLRADHDLNHEDFAKNKAGKLIGGAIGRTRQRDFGNVLNSYRQLHAKSVAWDVTGDRDEIIKLISTVQFIGKRRGSGFGEIAQWRLDTEQSDGLYNEANAPVRPIPTHLYDGDKSYPLADAAWKPAYWDINNRYVCYMPGAAA